MAEVLKTFPSGGIHPEENKITAGKPVQVLPVPDKIILPLLQHIGAPSKAKVNRGVKVRTGQQVAEANGFVSAAVHASATGKVKRITDVFTASGYRQTSVIIETEEDRWTGETDLSRELKTVIDLSREEIIKKVRESGIVGLGGATFPSHVKLSLPRGKTPEYLVVNGVECEPWLTSDHALMLERPEELLTGVRIMIRALGISRALIGIEANKRDAWEKLRNLTEGKDDISVHLLKVKYPQGGEKQLIQALLNRQVPAGGLPVDIGVVVFNVGTMFATYEAIQKNKPLVERMVTVTGKSVKKPGNFLVRTGTPVIRLIEAAGGIPENTGKIVAGGPMMGRALYDLEVPVTKGMSGILVIPAGESARKKPVNCIRCAKCVTVCPMKLEPYLLKAMAERNMFDELPGERIMDCVECGSCNYICPANLPLLDYIRLGKSHAGKTKPSKSK